MTRCRPESDLHFSLRLHLPTFRNQNVHPRLVVSPTLHVLDLSDHQHAFSNDPSEDSMLLIKPLRFRTCQEELTAICIWSTICGAQQTCACVATHKVLIREACAIDADGPRAVSLQEIATLDHEVFYDAVERHILIALRLTVALPELSSAKLSEIFCCLWRYICKQFHLNAACCDATDCHIKKHHGIPWVGRSQMPLRGFSHQLAAQNDRDRQLISPGSCALPIRVPNAMHLASPLAPLPDQPKTV